MNFVFVHVIENAPPSPTEVSVSLGSNIHGPELVLAPARAIIPRLRRISTPYTVDGVHVNNAHPTQLTRRLQNHTILAHNLHLALLPRRLLALQCPTFQSLPQALRTKKIESLNLYLRW
jgi:hypothetical protein